MQSTTPSSLVIQDFVIEFVKIRDVHNKIITMISIFLNMKSLAMFFYA